MPNERLNQILTGTNHTSLEDAIAADLVSALPIIGAITDFFRVLDSETRPQKALQVLDTLAEPFPVLNVVTPTNTLLYLDKKGMLPLKLEKIDTIAKKIIPKSR